METVNFFIIIILFNVVRYSDVIYREGKFYLSKNHYDLYGIKREHRHKEKDLEKMLSENFVYFQHLSILARKKFMARLWKCYQKAEFVCYQGMVANEEIKLRVLFAQVQLTFGLDTFLFQNINKYILYPETFYSNFFKRELKGLTSQAGFITLSWADFKHGYDVHHDKFNLGLHEMAHALRLDIYSNGKHSTSTDYHNNVFDRKALYEIELMRRDVPSILRDYAKTNDEEFFAVCVEYFFEAPELLHEVKPQLFRTLALLLNQNTLNKEEDYKVFKPWDQAFM